MLPLRCLMMCFNTFGRCEENEKEEEESDRFISMLEHIDDEANENAVPIKIVR